MRGGDERRFALALVSTWQKRPIELHVATRNEMIDGREPDGVYRIYVGFETASPAPEQWRLRIRNNDPHAGYRFTAVVADTPEGTLQPWIDVSRPTSSSSSVTR